jgi:hypothetical protein
MGIYGWGVAHWADIANGVAYAIAIASIVVKMTPTLKDDNALLAIIKFIGKYIALNVNTPNTRPQ